MNINSLLSKIDELREIARKTRATVIGITESKLDGSVLDGEINIDGYELVRGGRRREEDSDVDFEASRRSTREQSKSTIRSALFLAKH